MDTKLYEIYQIIEDIKTNITDNQYKKIMDNILILLSLNYLLIIPRAH